MWCDDVDMTRTTRTRLVLAVGSFVALAIFLPSTVRGSFPSGGQTRASDASGRADPGAALRVAVGADIAAIVSAPFERIWSQASSRGRFSLPVGDLASAALTHTALAVGLVLMAIAAARAIRLAANASDPRAPPQFLQRR
jgi:hypothetical protein